MRKILAILLTVLMLASVLAGIPTSALVTDSTTAADVPELMITEIAASSYIRWEKGSEKRAYQGMNYIELYNNTGAAVDAYSLSLLACPDYKVKPGATDKMFNYWDAWKNGYTDEIGGVKTPYRFLSKMDIVSGNIYKGSEATYTTAMGGLTLVNPATMSIADGEHLVIWTVDQNTIQALKQWKTDNNIDNLDPVTFFRNHYELAASVKVVMVFAYNSTDINGFLATDMFDLVNCSKTTSGYMYALAQNTWDLDSDVYYSVADGVNEKLYCLAPYGAKVSTFNGTTDDTSAVYVTADKTPAFLNKKEDQTYANYEAAGVIKSYTEMAVVHSMSALTPGTMEAWQWATINPEGAPASMKTSATWAADAIAAEAERLYGDVGELEDANDEGGKIDIKPPSQEDLYGTFIEGVHLEKDDDKKDDKKKDDGLPTVALVLIIVGAVVVVGGGATAAILVIKKKKAAAPVAETAPLTEEAPAEEAPAEEAPAEEPTEENKE